MWYTIARETTFGKTENIEIHTCHSTPKYMVKTEILKCHSTPKYMVKTEILKSHSNPKCMGGAMMVHHSWRDDV